MEQTKGFLTLTPALVNIVDSKSCEDLYWRFPSSRGFLPNWNFSESCYIATNGENEAFNSDYSLCLKHLKINSNKSQRLLLMLSWIKLYLKWTLWVRCLQLIRFMRTTKKTNTLEFHDEALWGCGSQLKYKPIRRSWPITSGKLYRVKFLQWLI